MANWQRTLNLVDIWENSEDNIPETARIIAERLRALKPFPTEFEELNEQREELACDFLDLYKDPTADTDEFNDIMRRLYDWADTAMDSNWNGKKACWVKTF
jgi:hypothetical protein